MTTMLYGLLSWAKTLSRHFWLSLSSIEFYRDVLGPYKGWGIKYILTLSFLSSFLCSVFLLNQIVAVREYFTSDVLSARVMNIDHIINQFPDLKYDGQNISFENKDEVVYLTSINNKKIVAIDPDNKLSHLERESIPFILNKNRITISLINSSGKTLYTPSFYYKKIFGDLPQTINQNLVKSALATLFKNAPEIFIYLVFPSIGLLIFVNTLTEKSFIIAMIYLLSTLLSMSVPLKVCIRMVLFASGPFILLQPLTMLIFPSLIKYVWMIQIWSNMLMAIALLKIKKR